MREVGQELIFLGVGCNKQSILLTVLSFPRQELKRGLDHPRDHLRLIEAMVGLVKSLSAAFGWSIPAQSFLKFSNLRIQIAVNLLSPGNFIPIKKVIFVFPFLLPSEISTPSKSLSHLP